MTSIQPEHLDGWLVSVDCPHIEKFAKNDNARIYEMADVLEDLYLRGQMAQYNKKAKEYGIKYVPGGMLYDREVRSIYLPREHTIEDWMHMLCSGGVANTHLGLLMQVLIKFGHSLDTLQMYFGLFTLPWKHGKVDLKWLSPLRLKDDNLQSFAGVLLTMLPIMLSYLETRVFDAELRDHKLCFSLLVNIVGILCLGADAAVSHVEKLRRLLRMHAELFNLLYPHAAKPKFHHLLHLTETMEFVKKLFSCFVTERFHKTTKAMVVHLFRHVEHTAAADIVNRKCIQMSTDENLFLAEFLVRAQPLGATHFGCKIANHAVLHCGDMHQGDFVWLRDKSVGQVVRFYQKDVEGIVVELELHPPVHDALHVFARGLGQRQFVNSDSIVDACSWAYKSEDSFFVIEPLTARACR